MKIIFNDEEELKEYIENENKELRKEIEYRDKILSCFDEYIKEFGHTYPN